MRHAAGNRMVFFQLFVIIFIALCASIRCIFKKREKEEGRLSNYSTVAIDEN